MRIFTVYDNVLYKDIFTSKYCILSIIFPTSYPFSFYPSLLLFSSFLSLDSLTSTVFVTEKKPLYVLQISSSISLLLYTSLVLKLNYSETCCSDNWCVHIFLAYWHRILRVSTRSSVCSWGPGGRSTFSFLRSFHIDFYILNSHYQCIRAPVSLSPHHHLLLFS